MKRPTSVHKLRPGDIDVVGAMGDSLTAASGAGGTDILHILMDYRGMSWTIGNKTDLRDYPKEIFPFYFDTFIQADRVPGEST